MHGNEVENSRGYRFRLVSSLPHLKSLDFSAPRKVRTVTGGRQEAIEIRQGGHRSSRSAPRASPTASFRRFTAVTTAEGYAVNVRMESQAADWQGDACYLQVTQQVDGQGDAWLAALRQIEATRRWCGAGLPWRDVRDTI